VPTSRAIWRGCRADSTASTSAPNPSSSSPKLTAWPASQWRRQRSQPPSLVSLGSTTPSHTPRAAVCSTAAASAKRPAGHLHPTVMASAVTATTVATVATASGPPMVPKYRYGCRGW
jgi:hypothetical protein